MAESGKSIQSGDDPPGSSSAYSKPKGSSLQCKICGAPALHSNYGAITCYSCKMFFKRHVTTIRRPLTCNFDGQCEIDINNRHTCPACRLEKCNANGMQAELIRCPLSRRISRTQPTTESISPTSNILNITTESDRLQLLPTIRSNESILNAEQWTLITNLIYTYDERKLITLAQQFFEAAEANVQQTFAREFFSKLYEITSLCIRSNSDFCTLYPDDRSAFLRNIAENVHCLGTAFTWQQSRIHQSPSFVPIFFETYGSGLFDSIQRILKFIDSDMITAKLALSIFAFCNHTSIFAPRRTNGPFNPLAIARVQNVYAEVTWKYLLHKYGYSQSIERFNRLIQCFLAATTTISDMQNVSKHLEDMKTLVEQTELHFVFDDIDCIDQNKN